MRFASSLAISVIYARSCGWYENCEMPSGAGVVLCFGMNGASFFDFIVSSKISSGSFTFGS